MATMRRFRVSGSDDAFGDLAGRGAGRILLVIGLIAIGVFAAYGHKPDNPALQAIFEFVKVGLLPLATLVVVLYFTKTDR